MRRTYVVGVLAVNLSGNIRINTRLETASEISTVKSREAPSFPSSSTAAVGGAIAWATSDFDAQKWPTSDALNWPTPEIPSILLIRQEGRDGEERYRVLLSIEVWLLNAKCDDR